MQSPDFHINVKSIVQILNGLLPQHRLELF